MFWIIAGVLLAVVLIGAWLYDRKHGFDLSHRDAGKFNQAEGDRDTTRFNTNYGNPGL